MYKYSLGAQRVLYAFQGTESFSTVLGQFKGVQQDLLGCKIRNRPGTLSVTHVQTLKLKVARVYAKIDKSYLGF